MKLNTEESHHASHKGCAFLYQLATLLHIYIFTYVIHYHLNRCDPTSASALGPRPMELEQNGVEYGT